MKYKPLFNLLLGFVFLFGGALQLVGAVSATISTIFFSLLLLLITSSSRFQLGFYRPMLILLGVMLVSTYVNHTKPVLTLLYVVTFLMVPFSVLGFVKRYRDVLSFKRIFTFFVYVGLVQLPVVLVQRVFSSTIAAMSARAIEEVDVVYGTFFLADDHAMCFLLLCLVVYLLNSDSEISARFSKKFLIGWYSVTLLAGNSNISKLLLAVIFLVYGIQHFNMKIFLRLATLAGLVGLVVYSFSTQLTEKLDRETEKFQDADANAATLGTGQQDDSKAERSEILTFFMSEQLNVIGDGPFSYYDPIKKEFPRFANYSQYLWFYQDIGIIGVISLMYLYIFYYFKYHRFKNYRILILMMILVFCLFTNNLGDLAFNIVFSVFLFVPDAPAAVAVPEPSYAYRRVPALEVD